MNFKKTSLLLSTLFLMGCNGGNVTSSEEESSEIVSSEVTSEEKSSSESSSSTEKWSENEITLKEAEKLLVKAKTFSNQTNYLKFYSKDGYRHDEVEYKRYPSFYTLEGIADSYTDAWEESNAIGYYGFPSDGSINVFYDVLKADVDTQHARVFTINDDKDPDSETEYTEEEANALLNNYENSIENFINETYWVLRNDWKEEYINKGTLKAERSVVDGKDTLHIVGSRDYTFLYQQYHTDISLTYVLNTNGSCSYASVEVDNGGIKNGSHLEVTYGDFYDPATLDKDIFNPEMYFVRKITPNFTDIYAQEKGKNTNTICVGSAAYLIPEQKNMIGTSMFSYLPQTAVDAWDINVLSSSDPSVIGYSEIDNCFIGLKEGKATLTVGAKNNPYCTTEVEVTVIHADPSVILAHAPYNQESYVGEAFTNTDVLLDVDIGPTAAIQDKIVSSSNEEIATAYINEKGQVMVHGKKEGYVNITVTSAIDEKVTKTFQFHVVGEMNTSRVVGSWEDDRYYSTYGMKFKYVFKEDGTGTLFFTAKDYDNKEVTNEIPVTYTLDTQTLDISITPIGWTVQKDLLTVHYYTSEFMQTHFAYGEYYFTINLAPVSE